MILVKENRCSVADQKTLYAVNSPENEGIDLKILEYTNKLLNNLSLHLFELVHEPKSFKFCEKNSKIHRQISIHDEEISFTNCDSCTTLTVLYQCKVLQALMEDATFPFDIPMCVFSQG